MYKNCKSHHNPIFKQRNKLHPEEDKKPTEPIKKTYDNIKNQVEGNGPPGRRK